MQHIEKPGDSNKNTDRPRSVYIATYGCQMNVRDSEVVCGILKDAGFQITDDAKKADVVLLNTCSVRKHAEDRVLSEAGTYKVTSGKRGLSSKGTFPEKKKLVGLIGCMAQNYKEGIFQMAPSVDFVVGPSDIAKIPEIIKKLTVSKKEGDSFFFTRKIWETGAEARPEEIYHTGFYSDKNHALVVISEGCSNFCSYCVVPYVRGPLRNRKHTNILDEIRQAIDAGITSFTLLGQNVNSYRDGDTDFIKLLELVNKVEGLNKFTFLTSHPKDTSVDLFKAMQGLDKIKKDLHLPVQSGSDKILKLMNRKYTRAFYLDLVDSYRKIVCNEALTTDIILGFPGETENDFLDTVSLIKKVKFNSAYIFKYSSRPHTEAFKTTDDVELKEKERRHRIILDLQRGLSKRVK